ncbi:acyltransferase family protein [Plantactinospora siamensis]|uniref:Acyltransferase family protein n=1 Tax=Plantactinospora siamensis TaxID=555372 RepID=A0ABV6NPB9_9ACTN
MAAWWRRWRPPTLADRFSTRDNAIGLLRLVLAGAVLVSHSWPLGLGEEDLGTTLTRRHTDLGTMAVYGFFVLSGFLITTSALRFPPGRYAWHRFLRIFPGLWVCLLVTAFGFAPLVAWYERGGLTGFWRHPEGPFRYVLVNALALINQYPISGLLAHVPYARLTGGRPTAFDGSLWSLRYELGCYLVVGLLGAAAVLRRRPAVVLGLAGATYAAVAVGWLRSPTGPPALGVLRVPLLGAFEVGQAVLLGLAFLLGAVLRLYRDRIPLHGALAAGAGLLLAGSLWLGGLLVLGLPAYAYLLCYAAVALPRRLRRIGRRRDYSYGIYIYAFPVQQTLALVGGARYGVGVFVLLSALGTAALAVPSWHFVERPALAWKDRPAPGRPWRRRPAAPSEDQTGPAMLTR